MVYDDPQDRWYVFDPVHLHELQMSALAASPDDLAGMISHIVANLTATYPRARGVSINADSSEWVFNNAGGAMGAMAPRHGNTAASKAARLKDAPERKLRHGLRGRIAAATPEVGKLAAGDATPRPARIRSGVNGGSRKRTPHAS